MAIVKKRSTFKIWTDVIFAIFLREIKSQFNDKIGIAWAIISPVSFIFMLSYLRGRMDGGLTHEMPTFIFMVCGMVLVQFFLALVGASSTALKKNRPLFAFRQVTPLSSIFAICGFQLLIKIAVIIVIGIICYYIKLDFSIADPLELIFTILKVTIIASSIGTISSIGCAFIPEIKKIQDLIMRPIFFISGIFFSLQDMPKEYWPYLDWNPLLHAVELTRYSVTHSYGKIGVSDFYLDMCTIVLAFLALACYHIGWKQAISR
jgi:capsular polysaccharide transport system permease protein